MLKKLNDIFEAAPFYWLLTPLIPAWIISIAPNDWISWALGGALWLFISVVWWVVVLMLIDRVDE